tara:strand:- start:861 stop:1577 length:717 start_codon:yes stop_codon:yes gene_type:complete
MIPKNIYQTWKTQNLPNKISKMHSRMLTQNPEYNHIIYTDEQMNDYMTSNADKEILDLYWKMNHIVAKADIWRYTILFERGGVYLDIDSKINKSLKNLIETDDEAIVTAETNKNLFVQWALIYSKNHKILEQTLTNILKDVSLNQNKFNHHSLTVENYAKAVFSVAKNSEKKINWDDITEDTNLTFKTKDCSFRLYGVDYNDYFSFKHKYNHLLRNRPKGTELESHWSNQQEVKQLYD